MKKLFSKLALLGIMLAVTQSSWAGDTYYKDLCVQVKAVGKGLVYVEPEGGKVSSQVWENQVTEDGDTKDFGTSTTIKGAWRCNALGEKHYFFGTFKASPSEGYKFDGFYSEEECTNYVKSASSNWFFKSDESKAENPVTWEDATKSPAYISVFNGDDDTEAKTSIDNYSYEGNESVDFAVYAKFSFIDYNVKYSTDQASMGTVTGPANYHIGDNITITAKPNIGYKFLGWSKTDNGSIVEELAASDEKLVDDVYTYTITAGATDYYAVFESVPVKVSYYIGGSYWGSYQDAQDGSINGNHPFGTYTLSPSNALIGAEITLTATPNPGFAFSHWTNNANDATTVLSTDATWTTTAEYEYYYPVFKLAPIVVGSTGWTTFSAATKIAFQDSDCKDDLNAYAVVEKSDDGELVFKRMKYTTNGFGLVCQAEPGSYEAKYTGLVFGDYYYRNYPTDYEDAKLSGETKTIDGVETTFPAYTNLLQGTPNGTFTVPTEDDGYKYYVLANKSQGVGFYLAGGGLVIPQNKAYLKISNASPAKTFYGFDELATGLVAAEAETETGNVEMYNVAGQKVTDSYRGVVIVNGKKFINK